MPKTTEKPQPIVTLAIVQGTTTPAVCQNWRKWLGAYIRRLFYLALAKSGLSSRIETFPASNYVPTQARAEFHNLVLCFCQVTRSHQSLQQGLTILQRYHIVFTTVIYVGDVMPNPRQRNIPVDKQEGAELQRRKELYEQATGETGDWGKALGVLTLGGLAALGIYALVKAAQPTPTSWQVTCPNRSCEAIFPVATTGSPPRLAQVTCPYCQTEMVVDFGSAQERRSYGMNGHSSLMAGATIVMSCHHCHRQMQVTVTAGEGANGAKPLRCPFCGGVAQYGIGEVT